MSPFVLLAPVLFAAHVLEEAPNFIRWINSFIDRPLPQGGFLAANVFPLAMTAVLAGLCAVFRTRKLPALLLLAWLSHFMFANALFHVAATVVATRYTPGAATAVLFYLPFFYWFVRQLITRLGATFDIVVLITVLAGLPMLLQGYLIVFRHTRFF
jgi:hypothetical protein